MSDVLIRRLLAADLEFADEVRQIAGWNQVREDWNRFLDLEPDGCFLAEIDGQRAGTVTTTCYGNELAWIGMVLVHPDFRRLGVGTALLKQAIQSLRADRKIRCVKLDATPEGLPLYEKLGFRPEWGLKRWWRGAGETTSDSRRSRVPLLVSDSNLALDREVFGANRSDLLSRLAANAITSVAGPEGSFALAREGARADYVGPVTVADAEQGEALCRQLIETLSADRELFWDLPDLNAGGAELARSLGFNPVRELTRMWLGETNFESDPRRQWGLADFAFG